MTFGREEEFGIRPIVDASSAKQKNNTKESRAEDPVTQAAGNEEKSEIAGSGDSRVESSRNMSPMPALESEDEEHPQTDALALAALRELLQLRSLASMTRAIEVVRQRREERERQHEREREGVQQQPEYVETIKRLVHDHVRQYLLRFENIWHRNPGHPDIEERPELFQGWLRSLATKFENSARQYEETITGENNAQRALLEARGFRLQTQASRDILAAFAVEFRKVAHNARHLANGDIYALAEFCLNKSICIILQSSGRPLTFATDGTLVFAEQPASQTPTPGLHRPERGPLSYLTQESRNGSAAAESIPRDVGRQRSANSCSHFTAPNSCGLRGSIQVQQQWGSDFEDGRIEHQCRGDDFHQQAQPSGTECDHCFHYEDEDGDAGLYYY